MNIEPRIIACGIGVAFAVAIIIDSTPLAVCALGLSSWLLDIVKDGHD